AGGGGGDALTIDLAHRAQGRLGGDPPKGFSRPSRARTDDAKRRALAIGPEAAEHARAQADVDRARQDDLQRFAAALGVEDVEIETVFAKYAGLLAELGDHALTAAADGRGDLERFGGKSMRHRARNDGRQQCGQSPWAHGSLRPMVTGLPAAGRQRPSGWK